MRAIYESTIVTIYAMNVFFASFIPIKILGFQDDTAFCITGFISFLSWYLFFTDEDLPDMSPRLHIFVWVQILLPFILKIIYCS